MVKKNLFTTSSQVKKTLKEVCVSLDKVFKLDISRKQLKTMLSSVTIFFGLMKTRVCTRKMAGDTKWHILSQTWWTQCYDMDVYACQSA